MIKLITGYGDYSADDILHLGQTVADNLPGIAILATLKPTPAEITAAVGNLTTAMAMIGPGRAQAVAAAVAALAKLLGLVATNAPQIAGVTDTDLAAIGLPIVKSRTRETSAPPAPQNLRVRHSGVAGEVLGVCDPVGPNIRGYESQYALDPNAGPWTDGGQFPNSRAFHWKGLTRGKDTWFRVAAVNTVGIGAWSDPATIMVT